MIKSLFDEEEVGKKTEKRKKRSFGGSLLFPDDDDDTASVGETDSDVDPKPADLESGKESSDNVVAFEKVKLEENKLSDRVEQSFELDIAELDDFAKSESIDLPATGIDANTPAADPVTETPAKQEGVSGYRDAEKKSEAKEDVVEILPFTPDTPGESMRKSGLAYSAGIAFFGSVFFMLILGWFADLLLGIQPWGTVVGIVIGGAIGMMQLFRISSRIYNPQPSDFEKVSLVSSEPDEDSIKEAPETDSKRTDADLAAVDTNAEVRPAIQLGGSSIDEIKGPLLETLNELDKKEDELTADGVDSDREPPQKSD